MAEADKKRKNKAIGTHSGSFHCDEALGCWLLLQTGAFQDAEVVRTRDPAVLNTLDVVIDVGGTYDPSTHRYDHHQREFKEVFGNGFSTKLSSAGLVYKHFGEEVVGKLIDGDVSKEDLRLLYLQLYKHFMEAVDGIDNGINQFDTDKAPLYLNSTTLSARVGHLNPEWNEEQTPAIYDAQFRQAMELAGLEFTHHLRSLYKAWLPARQVVQEALAGRHTVDPSGAVLTLRQPCPWKEHLFALEGEQGVQGQVLYVLYFASLENKWRVQCVPQELGRFEDRKSLPQQWRGLRDEELSKVSGIPGCVFVHSSGFTGGNATYEGALAMAQKAIAA